MSGPPPQPTPRSLSNLEGAKPGAFPGSLSLWCMTGHSVVGCLHTPCVQGSGETLLLRCCCALHTASQRSADLSPHTLDGASAHALTSSLVFVIVTSSSNALSPIRPPTTHLPSHARSPPWQQRPASLRVGRRLALPARLLSLLLRRGQRRCSPRPFGLRTAAARPRTATGRPERSQRPLRPWWQPRS